ncbi:hypothetical protein QBC42DRAFT_274397 [Cladorrhinum samala]|uniref:Uncharacterized protein n=1 Tax=Cladorrhinum samala TaxID=585594 RepID=A0AAV9HJ30_9PEZI|nr:hypothetical protein QBC42DRAFT_274397 [Cladorrhinum samala]
MPPTDILPLPPLIALILVIAAFSRFLSLTNSATTPFLSPVLHRSGSSNSTCDPHLTSTPPAKLVAIIPIPTRLIIALRRYLREHVPRTLWRVIIEEEEEEENLEDKKNNSTNHDDESEEKEEMNNDNEEMPMMMENVRMRIKNLRAARRRLGLGRTRLAGGKRITSNHNGPPRIPERKSSLGFDVGHHHFSKLNRREICGK